jgi:hypothetical protein
VRVLIAECVVPLAGKKLVIKVLKSGHKSSLMMREVRTGVRRYHVRADVDAVAPTQVLILERLRGVKYALQMIDVVKVGRSHTGLVFPYTNNT